MKVSTRIITSILPLLLLATPPAHAQNAEWQQAIEVGTTLVCDTENQVEMFVANYDGDAQTALNQVNEQVANPTACVVTTIAFVRGPQLATTKHHGTEYQIAKIIVVGVLTEAGLQPVNPAAYFSLFKIDGIEV